ncbi:MAG TPA: hypothetical protein VFM37_02065 [Pseudonocardiaceae bacterium]|nr:hypothetical protein [Pseudonocardiaceae bacterium]
MIRIGSLFSGGGGLDLAVLDVLAAEVVWHCEHEPPSKKAPRVDWLMGWSAGWTDVPGVSANDRLRIGGNGVVRQQGAAALRFLLDVLGGRSAA